MSTIQAIAEAVERLDVREQVELLKELPRHLKISPDDATWTKLAESAFEFRDNPGDATSDTV
jgi:hypothetical protein